MSENSHTVYYREDGRSALVEFSHGMTSYSSVGRITYSPGHPGPVFWFEKVSSEEEDFGVPADEILGILNRLTGNEKFPAAHPSMEDTQVLPKIVADPTSVDGIALR